MNGTSKDETKVQGKILVSNKTLKRNRDVDKKDLDDEPAQKNYANLIGDKGEITITPIRKMAADDKNNPSVA